MRRVPQLRNICYAVVAANQPFFCTNELAVSGDDQAAKARTKYVGGYTRDRKYEASSFCTFRYMHQAWRQAKQRQASSPLNRHRKTGEDRTAKKGNYQLSSRGKKGAKAVICTDKHGITPCCYLTPSSIVFIFNQSVRRRRRRWSNAPHAPRSATTETRKIDRTPRNHAAARLGQRPRMNAHQPANFEQCTTNIQSPPRDKTRQTGSKPNPMSPSCGATAATAGQD